MTSLISARKIPAEPSLSQEMTFIADDFPLRGLSARRASESPRNRGDLVPISLDMSDFGGLAHRGDISEVGERFDVVLNRASLNHEDSRKLAKSFQLLLDLSDIRRRNGSLAVSHGVDVFEVLVSKGCTDAQMLAAGLLHDFIEDYPAERGGRSKAVQRLTESGIFSGNWAGAIGLIRALTDTEEKFTLNKRAFYKGKIETLCRFPDPRARAVKVADIFVNAADARPDTRTLYKNACERFLKTQLKLSDGFDAAPIAREALSILRAHDTIRQRRTMAANARALPRVS